MNGRISRIDLAAIDTLRSLVLEKQSMGSPTVYVADPGFRSAMHRELIRIQEQWDIDGSIIVGRVDTSAGERYYVGHPRRTIVNFEPRLTVLAVDHPRAQALWEGTTAERPGTVVLKRHLSVVGWELVRSEDEFDLRRVADQTNPSPGTSQVGQGLALLQQNAEEAIAAAAESVRSGRTVGSGLTEAVSDWDDALSQAGAALGIAQESLSLDAVTAKMSGRRRRAELEAALAQLESMIALGGAAQAVLMSAREGLLREIAEADAR